MLPSQQLSTAGAPIPVKDTRDDSSSKDSSISSHLSVQTETLGSEFLKIEKGINTNNTCIQIVSFFQLTLMTLANEIPQLSAAITTTATQCLPGWGFACAMGLSALSSHQTYRKKSDQAELFYKQYTNSSLSDNDLEIIKGYWEKIHQHSKISEGTETTLSCLYAIFSLATLALVWPMAVGLSQSGNMSGYELTSILYSIVGKVWNYVDDAGAMILAACGCLNIKKIHQGSQERPTKTSYNHKKINTVEEIKALFIFNRIMKEAKEAEQTRNAYFACFVATCTIAAVTTVLAAGTVATGGALPVILFTTYVVLSLASVTMRYLDIHNREKDSYNYDHFTIRRVQDVGKSCCLKGHKKIIEEIIDKIKKYSIINLWRTDKINFTNAWSNLDKVGGMDWDSLYIVVAYWQGKFITLIGNHCIVKTIVMCGYGALIPCKIIYVGDTENDMERFMSRKHDIDSNKRTLLVKRAPIITGGVGHCK